MPSPLHVVVLCHPESTAATALARQLVERLYGPPATLALRVPTWLGPAQPDGGPPPLDALWASGADAVLLVYLLDARMAQRVDGGTGARWGEHLVAAIAQAGADPKRRSVVPLALEEGGFEVFPEGATRNARKLPDPAPLEAVRDAALQHVGIRALYLLSDRTPPAPLEAGRLQAPIQVFLSHAKADLDLLSLLDPVQCLRNALSNHAVEKWFDSEKIGPAEDFAARLEGAVKSSDVLLLVWTDHWSSRPWCRREILTAKRAGRTVVVVDALEDGTGRAFPYVGNAAWVRWRGPAEDASRAPSREEVAAAAREADRALTQVVLAALRSRHERAALGEPSNDATVHLCAAPEALDYAGRKIGTTFVYPDPPVPDEERAVLTGLGGYSLVTPLTRVAQTRLPEHLRSMAVSVSSPKDAALRARGLTEWHVETLTDEVHLAVLLAGLRIVYGGLLTFRPGDPSKTAVESTNFVRRLFDLARRHRDLARDLGLDWKHPIVNTPPWPLHATYGADELRLFGTVADLARGPTPDLRSLAYEPWPAGAFPKPDSAARLLAVGLGLRAMRRDVTWERLGEKRFVRRPRVVVGGPTASMGWLPGLVEEAYRSVAVGAPLYLLGAFGGAAGIVLDLLRGVDTPDTALMTEAAARDAVPHYEEAAALARDHGLPFERRADVAAALREAGKEGLAAALRNGLDDADNAELAGSRDGRRIAELILKGLHALPTTPDVVEAPPA